MECRLSPRDMAAKPGAVRTMRRFVGFGLVGLLLGLMGCSSNESESPNIDGGVDAILRGTVTRQDGSPVPETHVTAVTYDHPECGGTTLYTRPISMTVQPNGTYGAHLGASLLAPFQSCLEVSADPPDSTGLRPDTISGVLLDFRDTGALDTAVVNFVLEPK